MRDRRRSRQRLAHPDVETRGSGLLGEAPARGSPTGTCGFPFPCLLCALRRVDVLVDHHGPDEEPGLPVQARSSCTRSRRRGPRRRDARIPNSFLIAHRRRAQHGRASPPALLLLPRVGTGHRPARPGHALRRRSSCSRRCRASAAATSPPRCPTSASSSRSACKGLSLGLNAGLGNLGVSVMQVALPLGHDLRPVRRARRRAARSRRRRSGGDGGRGLDPERRARVGPDPRWCCRSAAWFRMDNLPIARASGRPPVRRSRRCSGSTCSGCAGAAGSAPAARAQGWQHVDRRCPSRSLVTLALLADVARRRARGSAEGSSRSSSEKHTWVMTLALHHDLRLVHRVLERASRSYQGRVRLPAGRSTPREADPERERAERADLRVARPARGLAGPARRRAGSPTASAARGSPSGPRSS